MESQQRNNLRLATVAQLSSQYPVFSEQALRFAVFKAADNGLSPAIIRLGRRVLIDVDEFERWIARHRVAATPK